MREQLPCGMMRKLPQFPGRLFSTLVPMLLDIADDPAWHISKSKDEDVGKTSRYSVAKECLVRLAISLGGNTIVPVVSELLLVYFGALYWPKHPAVLITSTEITEGCSQAKIRPLSVVPDKSFIDFFHPANGAEGGFDFLHGSTVETSIIIQANYPQILTVLLQNMMELNPTIEMQRQQTELHGLLCGCLQVFIQKLDKQLSDARADFLVDARVFKGVSNNLCGQLMAVSSGRFDVISRAQTILSVMCASLHLVASTKATFFGTIASIHSQILYDLISIVTVAHHFYNNGDGEHSTLMKARGKSIGLSLTAAVSAQAYSPEELDHNIATSSSNIKRIGFIGPEAMGCGIATNLLNMHFTVLGYDVSLPSLARFVETGGWAGTSPADVSNDEDILLLLPANDAPATSVLYGDDESVAALSVGASIILLSTTSIAFIAQMELRLHENIKDFHLVGTSVSGRVENAAAEVVAADGNEVLTRMSGGCLFIVLRFFTVSKTSDVAGLDWFPSAPFSTMCSAT